MIAEKAVANKRGSLAMAQPAVAARKMRAKKDAIPMDSVLSSACLVREDLLLNHGSDLSSEVVLLLLDALALLEADSALEGDGAAQSLGSAGDVLLDGELVVLDELLLQQAVLSIELVQLTLNDLDLDLLGLTGHLGIVVHLGQHDLLLLSQDFLGDLGLVPETGIQSSDLHSDVLTDLGSIDAALDSQVDQNTDLTTGVDVGNADVLSEEEEAADLDVLTDNENHLLLLLENGQLGAVVLALHQSIQISGVQSSDGSSHALDELLELLVLTNEVGLSVDLDHNTHTVDHSGVSSTLSGDTASLLGGSGQALLTQVLDSLVDVAVRLSQGLLAVHHANAGHLTQGLHINSGKSHFHILQ